MNWLVYHIVSGQAFFSGIILLVIAALASMSARPVYKRVTLLAFLIGTIAVVVSSTAIPYWLYAIASAVTLDQSHP
jgi:hypothetical protein